MSSNPVEASSSAVQPTSVRLLRAGSPAERISRIAPKPSSSGSAAAGDPM
jgi:hypothetical protein